MAVMTGSLISTWLLALPGQSESGAGWLVLLMGLAVPLCAVFLLSAMPGFGAGRTNSGAKRPQGPANTQPSRWISALYGLFFLVMSMALVHLQSQMVWLYFFRQTPVWVVRLLIIGVAVLTASVELSALGRLSEILLPVSLPLVLLFGTVIQEGRATNLSLTLPPPEAWTGMLTGAWAAFSGLAVLPFLPISAQTIKKGNKTLPLLPIGGSGTKKSDETTKKNNAAMKENGKGMARSKTKSALLAMSMVGLMAVMLSLTALCVLGGPMAAGLNFPVVMMLKVSDNAVTSRFGLLLLGVFCMVAQKPIGNLAMGFRLAGQSALPRTCPRQQDFAQAREDNPNNVTQSAEASQASLTQSAEAAQPNAAQPDESGPNTSTQSQKKAQTTKPNRKVLLWPCVWGVLCFAGSFAIPDMQAFFTWTPLLGGLSLIFLLVLPLLQLLFGGRSKHASR